MLCNPLYQIPRSAFLRALTPLLFTLVCGALLLISQPVQADLSERQVAEQIQQQYGGQILDIKRLEANNHSAYRIKLLQPSGHVKLLLIDARTGEPMSGGSPSASPP